MRIQVLFVFAVASLAGCGTNIGTSPNAEYDGGTSIGTATLSGSALGAVSVIVEVVQTPLTDGGYGLLFDAYGVTSFGPEFSFDAYVPGLALAAGRFAPPNLTAYGELSTSYSVTSANFWRGVSGFELNIDSAGPAYTYPVGAQRQIWPYPSGSLTVTLEPVWGTDGGATVSVTFAPPPN